MSECIKNIVEEFINTRYTTFTDFLTKVSHEGMYGYFNNYIDGQKCFGSWDNFVKVIEYVEAQETIKQNEIKTRATQIFQKHNIVCNSQKRVILDYLHDPQTQDDLLHNCDKNPSDKFLLLEIFYDVLLTESKYFYDKNLKLLENFTYKYDYPDKSEARRYIFHQVDVLSIIYGYKTKNQKYQILSNMFNVQNPILFTTKVKCTLRRILKKSKTKSFEKRLCEILSMSPYKRIQHFNILCAQWPSSKTNLKKCFELINQFENNLPRLDVQ